MDNIINYKINDLNNKGGKIIVPNSEIKNFLKFNPKGITVTSKEHLYSSIKKVDYDIYQLASVVIKNKSSDNTNINQYSIGDGEASPLFGYYGFTVECLLAILNVLKEGISYLEFTKLNKNQPNLVTSIDKIKNEIFTNNQLFDEFLKIYTLWYLPYRDSGFLKFLSCFSPLLSKNALDNIATSFNLNQREETEYSIKFIQFLINGNISLYNEVTDLKVSKLYERNQNQQLTILHSIYYDNVEEFKLLFKNKYIDLKFTINGGGNLNEDNSGIGNEINENNDQDRFLTTEEFWYLICIHNSSKIFQYLVREYNLINEDDQELNNNNNNNKEIDGSNGLYKDIVKVKISLKEIFSIAISTFSESILEQLLKLKPLKYFTDSSSTLSNKLFSIDTLLNCSNLTRDKIVNFFLFAMKNNIQFDNKLKKPMSNQLSIIYQMETNYLGSSSSLLDPILKNNNNNNNNKNTSNSNINSNNNSNNNKSNNNKSNNTTTTATIKPNPTSPDSSLANIIVKAVQATESIDLDPSLAVKFNSKFKRDSLFSCILSTCDECIYAIYSEYLTLFEKKIKEEYLNEDDIFLYVYYNGNFPTLSAVISDSKSKSRYRGIPLAFFCHDLTDASYFINSKNITIDFNSYIDVLKRFGLESDLNIPPQLQNRPEFTTIKYSPLQFFKKRDEVISNQSRKILSHPDFPSVLSSCRSNDFDVENFLNKNESQRIKEEEELLKQLDDEKKKEKEKEKLKKQKEKQLKKQQLKEKELKQQQEIQLKQQQQQLKLEKEKELKQQQEIQLKQQQEKLTLQKEQIQKNQLLQQQKQQEQKLKKQEQQQQKKQQEQQQKKKSQKQQSNKDQVVEKKKEIKEEEKEFEKLNINESSVSTSPTSISTSSSPNIAANNNNNNNNEYNIKIGKFKFNRKEENILGRGSNGTLVFKGIWNDKIPVAIKQMQKAFNPLISKEIEILIKLTDKNCLNLIRYIDQEEDESCVYLGLTLCDGSLQELFDKRQLEQFLGTNETRILDLIKDIINGIEFLHSQDIVHNDLNPRNILVKDQRFMISDLGLSKMEVSTSYSFSMHTPTGQEGYHPAEVLMEKRKTKAVDIFSLGCIIYFLLTNGQHPFGDQFFRVANIITNRPNLSTLSTINPLASDLIAHMISKNEKDRPTISSLISHPLFWNHFKKIAFIDAILNLTKDTLIFTPKFNKQLNEINEINELNIVNSNNNYNSNNYYNNVNNHSIINNNNNNNSILNNNHPIIINNNSSNNNLYLPKPWNQLIDSILLDNITNKQNQLMQETGKKIFIYQYDQVKDLVRCIRNTIQHHKDISKQILQSSKGTIIGREVLECLNNQESVLNYFESRIPNLIYHLYQKIKYHLDYKSIDYLNEFFII